MCDIWESEKMLETRHHWLPIVLVIYLPLTFVITYSIAAGTKHVEPGFPYISDTGTIPPESCIFGQLLNIGAVVAGIVVYIRYRHISIHFEITPYARLFYLNTAAFIIGIITTLGVSIVGNFQETNIIGVHLLGAFMAFVIGYVYCILQTIISYISARMASKYSNTSDIPGNSVNMRRFRVVLCIINFVFLLMLIIFTATAQSKGPGANVPVSKWTSSNPGFREHLIATISEWLAAFTVVIYFATFYTEFKYFRVKPPEMCYYNSELLNTRSGLSETTTNQQQNI